MKRDKTIIMTVNGLKKANTLINDLQKILELLNSKHNISRDEVIEKYYKEKYNIKLFHKKKNGLKYYICNYSKEQLIRLFNNNYK